MSEKTISDLNSEAVKIVMGADRWMRQDKSELKNVADMISASNYYDHVLGNSTKSPQEARDALYSDLEKTNHFVVNADEVDAFEKLETVVNGVKDRLVSTDWRIALKQLELIKVRKDKKYDKDAYAFILANDASYAAIMIIPARDSNDKN